MASGQKDHWTLLKLSVVNSSSIRRAGSRGWCDTSLDRTTTYSFLQNKRGQLHHTGQVAQLGDKSTREYNEREKKVCRRTRSVESMKFDNWRRMSLSKFAGIEPVYC